MRNLANYVSIIQSCHQLHANRYRAWASRISYSV